MLLLCFVLSALPGRADTGADPVGLLFLGNSYTFLGELDQVAAGLLIEGTGQTHAASRLADGGLTFADHLSRAQQEGSDWHAALVTSAEPAQWVVLQEQSQIPGFPEASQYYQDSLAAGGGLDALVAAQGGETLLLMTWGRRSGDEQNTAMYPDFSTMQDRLTEGYLRYVETWSTETRPVWVAPAGLAFQHIHDEIVAGGGDPQAEDSAFWALYQGDGSHPSPAGTYLVACVIYATLTGSSPVGLSAPEPITEPLPLQEAAAAVVLGDSPDIRYPWEDGGGADSGEGDSADTGGADTGTDSGGIDSGGTDSADTAGADSGGDTAAGSADDGVAARAVGRCGCGGASAGLLWLPWVARRRRRA